MLIEERTRIADEISRKMGPRYKIEASLELEDVSDMDSVAIFVHDFSYNVTAKMNLTKNSLCDDKFPMEEFIRHEMDRCVLYLASQDIGRRK